MDITVNLLLLLFAQVDVTQQCAGITGGSLRPRNYFHLSKEEIAPCTVEVDFVRWKKRIEILECDTCCWIFWRNKTWVFSLILLLFWKQRREIWEEKAFQNVICPSIFFLWSHLSLLRYSIVYVRVIVSTQFLVPTFYFPRDSIPSLSRMHVGPCLPGTGMKLNTAVTIKLSSPFLPFQIRSAAKKTKGEEATLAEICLKNSYTFQVLRRFLKPWLFDAHTLGNPVFAPTQFCLV